MEKGLEDNYSASQPSNLVPSDYHQLSRQQESSENSIEMVDYMVSNIPQPQPQISLDKLNFADVMQFADFGPKLPVNQTKISGGVGNDDDDENYLMQFLGGVQKEGVVEVKNRRKRARSVKTSDEAESQRRTHIAVERNRRRQMNEHIRMLRSLMPSSYVQRGDQASIIGGAIEFVRELEQLLMCLESQKRRRLLGGGEAQRAMTDAPPLPLINQPFFPPFPLQGGDRDQMKLLELDHSSMREEMAENKSCLADIEVRVLGSDATIKIMSPKRPGQLIKTITALEDLQFNIIHTNITTIEQTVLYSFNVKITSETSCTAEDIANSVQQILSFIDASI